MEVEGERQEGLALLVSLLLAPPAPERQGTRLPFIIINLNHAVSSANWEGPQERPCRRMAEREHPLHRVCVWRPQSQCMQGAFRRGPDGWAAKKPNAMWRA